MQLVLPFPAIDPVLFSFEIWGRTFSLHWYALAYIVGLLLAWRYVVFLLRRETLWPGRRAPMAPEMAEDLLTTMILGVVIGGRLGYVVFYQPLYFLTHPIDIIRIWDGGMSFHGGFIGVIIAGIIWCRRRGVDAWSLGDAIAAAAPIGLFLGRLANFINAELWGRPTTLPWGVVFPGEAAQDCPIFWGGGPCARHPSQLYEALGEGALLFALMAYLILRRDALKRPGRMISLFFIGYGAVRFAVEFVRQGDAHYISFANPWGHVIRFGDLVTSAGLTMGQLLSLPMLFIGLLLWWQRGKAGLRV